MWVEAEEGSRVEGGTAAEQDVYSDRNYILRKNSRWM